MIRVTVEILPSGDASRARKVAQIDAGNIGMNDDGTTNYLYSISEPEPLAGSPIEGSGIMKIKRQKHALHFVRKLLSTPDSGRILTEEQKAIVERMKTVGLEGDENAD